VLLTPPFGQGRAGESCLRILGKGGRRRRGYLRGLLVKGEEEEWGEGRIRDDGS